MSKSGTFLCTGLGGVSTGLGGGFWADNEAAWLTDEVGLRAEKAGLVASGLLADDVKAEMGLVGVESAGLGAQGLTASLTKAEVFWSSFGLEGLRPAACSICSRYFRATAGVDGDRFGCV